MRLKAISTLPFESVIVHQFPSSDQFAVAETIRRGLYRRRVRGEWLLLEDEELAAFCGLSRCDRAEDLPPALSAPVGCPPGEPGVTYRGLPGYPDYWIGDDGSVWSFVFNRESSWGRVQPSLGPGGYLQVNLGCDGARRSPVRTVHQLVLEAFVGPRPDGLVCCHDNDVKTDNRLSNLRYDTQAANCADAVRNGRTKRKAT